jgi:hypothetical protein
MSNAHKITVSVPDDLLAAGRRITGQGVTATIVEALRELQKREQRSALRRLKGRVTFDLDLGASRR